MTGRKKEPGAARMRFWIQLGPDTIPILSDPIVVGRSTTCHLGLPDDAHMSRKHVRFRPALGGVVLDDLGSSNGTFVDGKRIFGSKRLTGGERVRIGSTELRLVASRAAPARQKTTAKEPPRPRQVTPSDEISTTIDTLVEDPESGRPGSVDPTNHIPFLEVVREDLEAELPIPSGTAERAATYALEIALHLRDPTWIDYSIRLLSRLALGMAPRLCKKLEEGLKAVRGVDAAALLEYARLLETMGDPLPAPTRELIEQVAGSTS